ncbi:MAG: PAS domain S-box protein, partial [Ignavibacteria bacterium]|nr:PAS domain S-box protein [Ignavibacteria bacterium]
MNNEFDNSVSKEHENSINKNLRHESLSTLSMFDAIIESTLEGILVVNLNGRVTKTNRRFAELWRLPEQLIETRDDEKLLSYILDQLKDPQAFIAKVNDLYSKPEERSFDLIEFKDGRFFERTSLPQRINDQVVGRIWSFRDVTEQKTTEETLRKERILFRTIIDNLPDSIYAKDLEYRKILSNPVNLHNAGCTTESEVLGKTDFELFRHDAALAFYKDDKTVLELGRSVINREESFIDKEGHKVWLLTTKLPLKDSSGNITGLIGVGRNITLRKKNEMIRDALYAISQYVLITKDMSMLYPKIHQVISKLMNAKNFFIALYDEQEDMLTFPYVVDEYDNSLPSNKFGKGLIEYAMKLGEPVLIDAKEDIELRNTGKIEEVGLPPAIWLGVPLTEEEKTVGLIVLQDYQNPKAYGNDEVQLLSFVSEQIAYAITRKKNAEALEKYTVDLKELNKTKDKFFSIIAHDLKSPFQGLLGYSQILTTEYATLSEEEKIFFISGIGELTNSAFRLLENLLEWSRMQTGRITFDPETFQIEKEVSTTLLLLSQTAKNKDIDLEKNIEGDISVFADKNMLSTIIRNLISNSIKFTKQGGRITISAEL